MTPISAATQRSVLLLSFATFASMLAQRVCDAMLPELAREFSVSLAQAAQVVSFFAVVYGLSQLVYGPLGDRKGKFRIVALATMACSVGSLAAVFAVSLNTLLVARVMVALGAAAIIPLSMAWIGDVVDYKHRQATLARVGLGTTLGMAGGQLVGGLFTDFVGWRWAFVSLTLLFAVVGTLLWGEWRRQAMLVPPVGAQPVVRPGFVKQALMILTGGWSRIVLLVALIEGAVGFGVMAIWPSHLHHELGVSLSAAGAIVALFGLGGMGYMVVARHLIARLGEPGLVLVGVVLLAVSCCVLGFTPHWLPAALVSPVAGFGFFMFHNTMQINATQMAPAARGTSVSLFAMALFTGQSIGVLLAAALIERMGSAWVIALSGGIVLGVGWTFSQALRRRDAFMHLD
jgi:MFS transporter, YNFM family, putative membrane transport protein